MPDPTCERLLGSRIKPSGVLGDYVSGIIERWLLVAPLANPAMLEMFRDRDSPPLRDMVPWAGEFAGKYLTSAVQVLCLTGDARLRAWLGEFTAHLLDLQDADGYLGPWPRECRLTNAQIDGKSTWDTWGHYHIMLGLLLWHGESGDSRALQGAIRIADRLCTQYGGDPAVRLVDTLNTDKNLAPVHALCMLYRVTGTQRYLDMALQIVAEFAARGPEGPLAGDYVRQALDGVPFYQTSKPRWESLHSIMGLAELYWITGEATYRRAFEHLWWSMLELERHNNGGFTSGEKATGNPYDPHAIETCCTIAWIAMGVEMLKLTGNSIIADEIELATLNSVLGMHSSTGRWATYDTPMDGVRRASAHTIVFQAREGSPELNCCSVNSPRGFGMLSEWALMRSEDALLLNLYGPATITAAPTTDHSSPIETGITLTQVTDYPASGHIALQVDPATPCDFCLKLRIPHWSRDTQVQVNGEPIADVRDGTYLPIRRRWVRGDTVVIDLDMSLHFWSGERECQGLTSIYRGPVLLTYDHRYNLHLAQDAPRRKRSDAEWQEDKAALLPVPALDASRMQGRQVRWEDWLPPALLLEYTAADGTPVRLCDFGSAGEAGTPYRTWLSIDHAPGAVAFSRQNPLRSARL
jgi:DUF1680 family protein